MNMNPTALILEGPACAGVTRHADALADALSALGYCARVARPTPSRNASELGREIEYMRARAAAIASAAPGSVVIFDRGPESVAARGVALQASDDTAADALGAALRSVARRGVPAAGTLYLNAPEEVLARRAVGRIPAVPLTERDSAEELLAAAQTLGARIPDTSRPFDEVHAEVIAWALGVIGGAP